MTRNKKILIFVAIALVMSSIMAICSFANYFVVEGGTYNTYMNSNVSFSSYYYTDSNPTMEYRYKNLKCDTDSATLYTTLYAHRIHWYNILSPSEHEIGTSRCSGLNKTDGYWYGYTYEDIDCASVSDILTKWDHYVFDEAYNLRYYYDISNNGGDKIYNSKGEWKVICSY